MKKIVGIMLKAFIIVLLLNMLCVEKWDPPEQSTGQNTYPDFAYDGYNFFVVWGGDNIYGRIITHEGGFVTPVFEISSSNNIEGEPEIIRLGSSFLIVWEEHLGEDTVRICCKKYDRYYLPVSNSWTELLRGEGLSSPRIEKHTDEFVVLWYEWEMLDYNGYVSLFSSSGAEIQRTFLYDYTHDYAQPNTSIQPLVRADNADRYFLCGKSSALILDQNLNTINYIDLPRSEETYSCYGYDKWINIVAVDTHSYFENLVITRVSSDGTVIPPEKITIERERSFSNLTVCAGDSIFLCVWRQSDDGNITTNYIRLDSDGNVIDDKYFVLFEDIRFQMARLKYARNKFFLLWELWAAEEGDEEIHCSIISQEGESLSARTIKISE